MTWTWPTLSDVLDARRRIAPYLVRTPLHFSPSLSQLLGCQVYVKHENHQPVGAFKVRGGINLISRLSPDERRRGVIAASTGNHGQSVAYAARLFGVKALIGVPEGANPDKVESMRNLGAEILFHGKDFDEARLKVEELAHRDGYRYIHSANEPLLVAGVGTIGLEILEDLPDVDFVFAPVGGGSGAAGISIVARAANPRIQVIGVQSEKAPAAYLSWKQGNLVETGSCDTFADGLATRSAFQLTQEILRQNLADFVLVSEEELERSIVLLLEKTHNLAEGAGAAALAGALKCRDRLAGKKVVVDLSGGNLTAGTLKRILERQISQVRS